MLLVVNITIPTTLPTLDGGTMSLESVTIDDGSDPAPAQVAPYAAGRSDGEFPEAPPQPIPPPVLDANKFANLKSKASTGRGTCIDDGSTGQCLQGVTQWIYGLTGNPYFATATGSSAYQVRTGGTSSNYFEDSKYYKDKVTFPSNYVPRVGDVVLGQNHIITYLGNRPDGSQIWYSDFPDQSPQYYMNNNGWNPSEMKLIRLNPDGQAAVVANQYGTQAYFDDPNAAAAQGAEQQERSEPVQVAHSGGANAAYPQTGGDDGTGTGVFSTPNVGSKVWVFFYGGDVQKPVYFAQALDSASIKQANQYGGDYESSGGESYIDSTLPPAGEENAPTSGTTPSGTTTGGTTTVENNPPTSPSSGTPTSGLPGQTTGGTTGGSTGTGT